MELKLNSGDVITIPDDCKAVIKDKIITVEKEVQEFKDGDFCTVKTSYGNYIFIYKSNKYDDIVYYYSISLSGFRQHLYNSSCLVPKDGISLSTKEEKQMLLYALHADGKDWDAVNKRIVEYKWRPKHGEPYYMINTLFNVLKCTWSSSGFDFDLLVNRNCFKTEEEAKAKANEIIKIINK